MSDEAVVGEGQEDPSMDIMSDETVVGEEREDPSMDKWKPAIRAGLALIAVLVVTFIFYIFITIVLSDYLRPLWVFWSEFDTGNHPVYSAIFYLLNGALLLVLADILVMNKGWVEALFDELQLTVSKPALKYLLVGAIFGAAATIAMEVAWTLSGTCLFSGYVDIGLIPEKFAVAVLFIVPLLVMSVGQVALVQGYFQRTISKNYGRAAGIAVAALIYMLLFGFPDISLLLQGSDNLEMFLIWKALVVSAFIQTIVIGVIIACLFLRSKSLYVPIGFIFAWHLFSYVFDGFVSLHYTGLDLTFPVSIPGYYVYPVSSILQMLLSFLVLAIIWYFYHNSPDDISDIKGTLQNVASKLQNVTNFFRYHDEEE